MASVDPRQQNVGVPLGVVFMGVALVDLVKCRLFVATARGLA